VLCKVQEGAAFSLALVKDEIVFARRKRGASPVPPFEGFFETRNKK
jgi:hypothetical protein